MWKRDEPDRAAKTPPPAGPAPVAGNPVAGSQSPPAGLREPEVVNIGKSVMIKGELSGSEDLTIEGQVDGKIELREHVLTIGPHGKITAEVLAKSVVVLGQIHGNITATEKISIRENGSVEGDVTAPRVAIAEGAHFRGSIDMQRSATRAGGDTPVPASSSAPVAAAPARSARQ